MNCLYDSNTRVSDQTPPGGPDDQEDYSDLSEEEDYDIDELGSEIDSEDYEIEEEDDSQ